MQSDPKLLQDEAIRTKYQERLHHNNYNIDPECGVQESWEKLRQRLQKSVSEVLRGQTHLPPDRGCRYAHAQVCKYSFWVNRSDNPKWVHKLEEAREILKRKLREYEEREIESFFSNLQQYPVGDRVRRTYQFLKRYKKKQSSQRFRSTIRIQDWGIEDCSNLQIPELFPESESTVPFPPPSLREVEAIIGRMKNGKAPGVDGLYLEFFKYSDSQTLKDLHKLMVKVWNENTLPEEWRHVVQVPIPKVKQAKTPDQYRKISLSCTAYKVYASWILEKLMELVGPIGLHQAAFLPERSVTDHLFVLQRVLQENWNEGTPLIVMSLDIEKAFDHVSLLSLPAILRGMYLQISKEVRTLLHHRR